MDNKINKVHTIMDLCISGVFIVAGIGLFFVNKGVGALLFICGFLLLIFYKSGYKHENSGAILKHKSLELSRKCQDSVLHFLNGQSSDFEMITGNDGGSILLEIWYSKRDNVAYAQLFTFQEMSYQKFTEIMELPANAAQKLMEKL